MRKSLPFTALAFLASVASVAGSLYLTHVLDLIACPLCLYQRTFAFAAFGILLLGLLTKARGTGYVNLLALFPTVAGGAIAGWHVYLEAAGKLKCPMGIYEIGTTPQQSLASFILIATGLGLGLLSDIRSKATSGVSAAISTLLGVVMAWACVTSAPPPSQPKPEIAPRICHPPSS